MGRPLHGECPWRILTRQVRRMFERAGPAGPCGPVRGRPRCGHHRKPVLV